MTPQQQTNVLTWVEALLSGQYKHGKYTLYNRWTGCHSALGVAFDIFKPVTFDDNIVLLDKQGLWAAERWVGETFGLGRFVNMYSTMNDKTNDYLAVVALLLHAVPDKKSNRYQSLHTKFMEQADAAQTYGHTKR